MDTKVNVNISFLFVILSFMYQLTSSFLTSKSIATERAMGGPSNAEVLKQSTRTPWEGGSNNLSTGVT